MRGHRCRQLIAGALFCSIACATAAPARATQSGAGTLAATPAGMPDQTALPRSTIRRDQPASTAPAALLGQLPLAFAARCGSRSVDSEFIARGFGYRVEVAPDTARIGILRSRGADPRQAATRTVDVVGTKDTD